MSKAPLVPFTDLIRAALAAGTFVKLTMAGYKGPDKTLKRILAHRATIKGRDQLSFTYRHQTRDITKNAPLPDDALAVITDALQSGFTAATLFTTEYDYTYPNLKKSKPLHKIAPNPAHDRAKNHAVNQNAPYLHALGITTADGKIHAKSQDKFRQISKFIEVLTPLLAPIQNPHAIDMGAGKGYLTFALYDHLQTTKKNAVVRGIEYRPDLVGLCNDIAFACDYNALSFEQGTIADANMQDANIVIALHACDTATDDALAKAIAANAELIVVAPCCHKQIRRDMPPIDKAHPLHDALQHGIYMERHCEMLTDTMRAQILESRGYKVKIFEFISDAHTAKNVMITAVRTGRANTESAARLQALKAFYGLPVHYLEKSIK